MSSLFDSNSFFTGCNYWASHAGTAMWRDWRPEVVESDFKRLAENNVKILRVFPLWLDFQPISILRGCFGRPVEYAIGETPLGDDDEGRAGMSHEAVEHFEEFTALARKYSLTLIVGLITGWMSGRLHVPPALDGLNALTNPVAIMWEVRFVQYFVKRFKDCPAIAAWDLGNECNCMAEVETREQAWNWISAITNAIKSQDAVRPVVSGMNGLLPGENWALQDQAEVVDILTTHPYPYFTPYCDQDAINTMRTGLQATAETLFYRGIGGKPCFVEEMGTLGPMFASDEIAADFVRNNLFTLWAHGCLGLLWWCVNEQSHLRHASYDWAAVERELGLFYLDGRPKPALKELTEFTRFAAEYLGGRLPDRLVDGVCILTKGQDAWGVAYSAFVLAKQAGLDIEYRYSDESIPDAPLYLLPGIRGCISITDRQMKKLLKKVEQGASLYLSIDDGLMSPFSEFTGVRVVTRVKCAEAGIVDITTPSGKAKVELKGTYKFILEVLNTEVLATDQEGNPAFTSVRYGVGRVFFLNYPVETYLLDKPGVFTDKKAMPYYVLYRHLKASLPKVKAVDKACPTIGVTEHRLESGSRAIIAINYEPEDMVAELDIADGWEVSGDVYGKTPVAGSHGKVRVQISKNDAAVFTIQRTS